MTTARSTTRFGIVVGVTGTGQDTAALLWAGRRAALTGADVTLVHAYGHVLPPPPPSVLMTAEPMGEAATYLLGGCAESYLHVAPKGVAEPATVLDDRVPARVLTELSSQADVVVLSHRERSHRIHTGSTTMTVATRAHCPVVSVPAGRNPQTAEDAEWVTVGVHEQGVPNKVLEAAAREAALLGAPLRLVHAWRLDTVYDDIVSVRIDPDWQQRTERALRSAAEPVLSQHPGLKVEVLAEHEWPVDALARHALDSRLLVVGRHAHHAPFPSILGSVARTAIRTATCPVMVVPL